MRTTLELIVAFIRGGNESVIPTNLRYFKRETCEKVIAEYKAETAHIYRIEV